MILDGIVNQVKQNYLQRILHFQIHQVKDYVNNHLVGIVIATIDTRHSLATC